ncbi:asparagine synthase (glutamine-hydrolyzing) [Sphingomonas sp. DG1-23]|uniref:asparagine synthase (glutamine-hydrolyzing) n=1 Tax=Sphingomonas sp. DG1-23 TaxID=3068316 RepID=UPI00273E87A3|nr:asparagine synthase (glutamine-hydrolyzing) [Sphingomonas sp. DG1-23]MDP5279857.1 asparagine synthase (glutamine-hydrolyzing) [Sphingomonas sp. DG1-23]
MCGIAGYADPAIGPGEALARLTPALERLRARGPEGRASVWNAGVALGHTMLSFLDAEHGAQPMETPDRSAALTFNGEIYNARELAADLARRGVTLTGHCDAEVVLHLLRLDGFAALARLDGMFALAFHDRSAGTLLLARDRFGEKPLFWACLPGGGLAFSSQLDALAVLAPAGVDPHALVGFLRYNAVGWPHAMLKGARKVAPGTAIAFSGGVARECRYWAPAIHGDDEPEDAGDLTALFVERVRRCLTTSDVPLGLFLSGGLDSALVAAAACRADLQPPAWTLGFEEASYDESDAAAETARSLGLQHHIVRVGLADLAAAATRLLDAVDEPIGDPSLLPTSLLVEAACQQVKGALGGDGADDLFFGYPFYSTLALYRLADRLDERMLRGLLALIPAGTRNMHPALILRQLTRGVGVAPHMRFAEVYGAFDAEELPAVLAPELHEQLGDAEEPMVWPGARYDPADQIAQTHLGMLRHFLTDVILTKIDRAGMGLGFEIRSPFLGADIAAAAFGMPRRAKYSRGKGKLALRRLASDLLPPAVRERRKRGFRMPLAAMLRGPFREEARASLLDAPASCRLFRSSACERLLDEHHRGRVDHQKKLWAMISAQRWANRIPA